MVCVRINRAYLNPELTGMMEFNVAPKKVATVEGKNLLFVYDREIPTEEEEPELYGLATRVRDTVIKMAEYAIKGISVCRIPYLEERCLFFEGVEGEVAVILRTQGLEDGRDKIPDLPEPETLYVEVCNECNE